MSSGSFEKRLGRKPNAATQLANLGRDPERQHGFVNPAVQRGSTVLFPTLQALIDYKQEFTYGRRGTPTTRQLEAAIQALESGERTYLTPSGYSAVTSALMAFTSPGDHILVVDSVYWPVRRFCDVVLKRFGVAVTYYDPLIGADIAALVRPETKAILAESPGSNTFEVQDISAMAAAAHTRGLWLMMDNTWASPLYFQPLKHGVDVSIQSATKYVTGHADTMLGLITVNTRAQPLMETYYENSGLCVAPEDCFLALRGLRTLDVRLERHGRSALRVAEWLAGRPEVAHVAYPVLERDKGHALWQRYFSGASGLFAVALKPAPRERLAAMLDGLTLFGLGYSWGGYESLVVPFQCGDREHAPEWTNGAVLLRFHIGLEDPDDLIADLAAGFERLNPL
jgi:cystathionine beta-lyase